MSSCACVLGSIAGLLEPMSFTVVVIVHAQADKSHASAYPTDTVATLVNAVFAIDKSSFSHVRSQFLEFQLRRFFYCTASETVFILFANDTHQASIRKWRY